MTQNSRPWAGQTIGDAGAYSDTDWSNTWQHLIAGARTQNGALQGSGDGTNAPLEVAAQSSPDKTVRVFSGAAIVAGKYYNSSATENLTIANNTSGSPRIDSVILRADYGAQTVRLVVKQGTPAGTPAAPSLTQNKGVTYEVRLADVAVANGFSTITNSEITNYDPDTNLMDIQEFTANGTWTKPDGAKLIEVYLYAGGGGGGSGREGATSTVRGGGGGGSAGGVLHAILPASLFGDTESVAVGAGGSGGAAVSTSNTNGNNGSPGGNTTLSVSTITPDLQAIGGNEGAGGSSGGGGAGGGFVTCIVSNMGNKTNSTNGGTGAGASASTPQNSTDELVLSTSGGGGASINASNVGQAVSGGSPKGDPSTTGWDSISFVTSPTTPITLGGRGGAGGDLTAGVDGGFPGGGGGGGSGNTNGSPSGAGGTGGAGYALIISHF